MKNKIIISVVLILLYACSVQKKYQNNKVIENDKVANYRLPKRSKPITRENIPIKPGVLANEIGDGIKHLYEIDNIILGVTDGKSFKKVDTAFLQSNKRGFDEIYKLGADESTQYSSELKDIHQNHLLAFRYFRKETGFYRYFLYSPNYDKAITGIVQFDRADSTKAKEILNNFLDSITFK